MCSSELKEMHPICHEKTALLCTPDPGSLLYALHPYSEGLGLVSPQPIRATIIIWQSAVLHSPRETSLRWNTDRCFLITRQGGWFCPRGNLHSRHITHANHAPWAETGRKGGGWWPTCPLYLLRKHPLPHGMCTLSPSLSPPCLGKPPPPVSSLTWFRS